MFERIFLNPKTNRLRSGWQTVIFFLIVTVLVSSLFLLSSPFLRGFGVDASSEKITLGARISQQAIVAVGAFFAAVYCSWLMRKGSIAAVGYAFVPGWWRDAAGGLLVGIGLLSLVAGTIVLTGAGTVARQPVTVGTLGVALAQAVVLFVASGVYEEVCYRGFPLRAMLETMRPDRAIGVTALLFTFAHGGNPGTTRLALINVLVAGLWLGVARYKRGNLWLATGLHVGWNLATTWLWGAPVSGFDKLFSGTVCAMTLTGPGWLSGGQFGPEGSVICTVVLLATTLLMAFKLKQSPAARIVIRREES